MIFRKERGNIDSTKRTGRGKPRGTCMIMCDHDDTVKSSRRSFQQSGSWTGHWSWHALARSWLENDRISSSRCNDKNYVAWRERSATPRSEDGGETPKFNVTCFPTGLMSTSKFRSREYTYGSCATLDWRWMTSARQVPHSLQKQDTVHFTSSVKEHTQIYLHITYSLPP